MPYEQTPAEIPVEQNTEGPEDTGVDPNALSPQMPSYSPEGDEIAQQVDEMEKRVLAESSPEVKEAVEEIDEENPGVNHDTEGDEPPAPERDNPA